MLKSYLTPINSNWCYSRAPNIKNSSLIIDELLKLVNEDTTFVFNSTHIAYLNYNWDIVYSKLKVLYDIFSEVGIEKKVDRILCTNLEFKQKAKIHVDSYIPTYTPWALNFPLQNCKGSYIGFYEPIDNAKLKPASFYGDAPTSADQYNFATIEFTEAREISRFEMTEPVLVNTSMLHGAITEDPMRIIASIRFKFYDLPTTKQLEKLGVLTPFVQNE